VGVGVAGSVAGGGVGVGVGVGSGGVGVALGVGSSERVGSAVGRLGSDVGRLGSDTEMLGSAVGRLTLGRSLGSEMPPPPQPASSRPPAAVTSTSRARTSSLLRGPRPHAPTVPHVGPSSQRDTRGRAGS